MDTPGVSAEAVDAEDGRGRERYRFRLKTRVSNDQVMGGGLTLHRSPAGTTTIEMYTILDKQWRV